MITHTDFDSGSNGTLSKDYELPAEVDSISVSHDGGRLSITINGQEAYSAMGGTRDCEIVIKRDNSKAEKTDNQPPASSDPRDNSVHAERIKALIFNFLDLHGHNGLQRPGQLRASHSIVDDYGADSLEQVEVVMMLEDEFGIEIPDAEAEKLHTLGNIIELIDHKVKP